MAFHFSLDALLRVRQGLEHQQELMLAEANDRLAFLQKGLEELNACVTSSAQQALRQLAAGLSGAELQFDLLCRSLLAERRSRLERQMIDARAARDTCADRFRHARQQREIVDTLRQKQYGLYRQLDARRQQRAVDDMFLLRRSRRESS